MRFDRETVLVPGGTGGFAGKFSEIPLRGPQKLKSLITFSREQLEQRDAGRAMNRGNSALQA